jgi:hypothetical protein
MMISIHLPFNSVASASHGIAKFVLENEKSQKMFCRDINFEFSRAEHGEMQQFIDV